MGFHLINQGGVRNLQRVSSFSNWICVLRNVRKWTLRCYGFCIMQDWFTELVIQIPWVEGKLPKFFQWSFFANFFNSYFRVEVETLVVLNGWGSVWWIVFDAINGEGNFGSLGSILQRIVQFCTKLMKYFAE